MEEPRREEFSDVEIKAVLDNCRLDYVYEPDWARLVARTCALLAGAKSVAWCQNARAGGVPAVNAERVVLSDPAARFVRDNINVFLLGRPLEAPLPIVISLAHAASALADPPSVFERRSSRPRADQRRAFGAALDSDGQCSVCVIDPASAVAIGDLCNAWLAKTGRPALVAIDFTVDGSRRVNDPRTAVQGFFSSAIDALVIGRFLLMKDYWLMRSGA